MSVVPVELGENSYNIYIENDLGGKIIDFCEKNNFSKKTLIITDNNVGPLYGEVLKGMLKKGGLEPEIAQIEAGESAKSLQSFEALLTRCIELGLDRKSPVFALVAVWLVIWLALWRLPICGGCPLFKYLPVCWPRWIPVWGARWQ